MIEIRDAVPSDLFRLPGGRMLTRAHGRGFAMQLGGQAFAVLADGQPVALTGFWPMEGWREAWLVADRRLTAKSVMPGAVAAMAARLAALYDPALPTVAAVALDNRGGRAIAGRLGFVDAGDHPMHAGAAMFVLAPPR